MLRKAYVLAVPLLVASLVHFTSAGELYSSLVRLEGRSYESRDIELCAYTGSFEAPGNATVNPPAVQPSHDSWCDPCRPGGTGLFGSPVGVGETQGDSSLRLGPRPLFPGVGMQADPNARGSAWIWVGPSWSQSEAFTAGDMEIGISEGIIAGYRLTNALGLFGAIAFSHSDGDTFIFSSIGIQKFGNPGGTGLIERSSLWVFWDNGVDTIDGDEGHFQQLRFNTGVVGPGGGEVGMAFTVPLDESGYSFLLPVGGTSMIATGGFTIGPYVRFPIGIFDLTAMLGFAEQTDSAVLGLGGEARLTERSSIFLDWKTGGADVGENPSTLLVGYKLGFGRADTTRY